MMSWFGVSSRTRLFRTVGPNESLRCIFVMWTTAWRIWWLFSTLFKPPTAPGWIMLDSVLSPCVTFNTSCVFVTIMQSGLHAMTFSNYWWCLMMIGRKMFTPKQRQHQGWEFSCCCCQCTPELQNRMWCFDDVLHARPITRTFKNKQTNKQTK